MRMGARPLLAVVAVCAVGAMAARSQADARVAYWLEQPLDSVVVQPRELGDDAMVLSNGPVSPADAAHPLNHQRCECAFTDAYALNAVTDGLAIGHFVYAYRSAADAVHDAGTLRESYAVAPATTLMASGDGRRWLVRVPDGDTEHPTSYFWFASVAGDKLSLLMVGLPDAAFSEHALWLAEQQLADPDLFPELRDQFAAASRSAISLLEQGNLARWYPWGAEALRAAMRGN